MVNVDGRVIEVKLVQLAKEPIDVTLSGIITVVRLEQPLKSPVEVTLLGILIEIKPEQLVKALLILVRLSGNLMEVRDLQE